MMFKALNNWTKYEYVYVLNSLERNFERISSVLSCTCFFISIPHPTITKSLQYQQPVDSPSKKLNIELSPEL